MSSESQAAYWNTPNARLKSCWLSRPRISPLERRGTRRCSAGKSANLFGMADPELFKRLFRILLGQSFRLPNTPVLRACRHPTIVWSSLIGLTFVEAFERLGDARYLEIARSTCDFVLRDLARIRGPRGFCFSYIPRTDVVVHNSNALGAALLARVFMHSREQELKRAAHSALEFTAHHQNPTEAGTTVPRLTCIGLTTGIPLTYSIVSMITFAAPKKRHLSKYAARGGSFTVLTSFCRTAPPSTTTIRCGRSIFSVRRRPWKRSAGFTHGTQILWRLLAESPCGRSHTCRVATDTSITSGKSTGPTKPQPCTGVRQQC